MDLNYICKHDTDSIQVCVCVNKALRQVRDIITFLSMIFSLTRVEIFSSNFEFLSCKSLALDSRSVTYTFFLSRACWADTLFLSNLLRGDYALDHSPYFQQGQYTYLIVLNDYCTQETICISTKNMMAYLPSSYHLFYKIKLPSIWRNVLQCITWPFKRLPYTL